MPVLTVYNPGTGGSSTKSFDKLESVHCFGKLHRIYDPGCARIDWSIT